MLPITARPVAVLDRTKEPGCGGEPLYLDCVNALYEQGHSDVRVVGGRYGLSSKEFTPAMIKAVFDNLAQRSPENHFTVGQNLLNVRTQFARLRIDDLEFLLDPESEDVLFRAHHSCG
jgi:pyruvate-ferredoxin/flavodoxin oxidoreductase